MRLSLMRLGYASRSRLPHVLTTYLSFRSCGLRVDSRSFLLMLRPNAIRRVHALLGVPPGLCYLRHRQSHTNCLNVQQFRDLSLDEVHVPVTRFMGRHAALLAFVELAARTNVANDAILID